MAIDPGTTESAYVILDDSYQIISADKVGNDVILSIIADAPGLDAVIIEDIEPRYSSSDRSAAGAVMGQSTIETIKAFGRFSWQASLRGLMVGSIFRRDERSCLIPTKRNGLPPLPETAPKHADGQIRASLIRRFARHDKERGRGTKANPDTFYGFHGDMWQAMAVGVTWLDQAKWRAKCGQKEKTRKR
nr:MAG TPA: crossover junction endodeoxyribonuclease [Caudoviricetes sp.]